MNTRPVGRRGLIAGAAGLAAMHALARYVGAAELRPDHEALLYTGKFQEPIALVVRPKNLAFRVTADLLPAPWVLTPAEYRTLVGTLSPAKDSRLLPAGIEVWITPRYEHAVKVESAYSGTRLVITDPDNRDGGGGGGGGGGCFTPETMVVMADGSRKPIGKIAAGEVVRAYDFLASRFFPSSV